MSTTRIVGGIGAALIALIGLGGASTGGPVVSIIGLGVATGWAALFELLHQVQRVADGIDELNTQLGPVSRWYLESSRNISRQNGGQE